MKNHAAHKEMCISCELDLSLLHGHSFPQQFLGWITPGKPELDPARHVRPSEQSDGLPAAQRFSCKHGENEDSAKMV